jgi:hypothetical protein
MTPASDESPTIWGEFYEVLQIKKLLTVFDVYDSEAAALHSFQSLLAASN